MGEVAHAQVREAIARIRGTGAQIRSQGPLLANINDNAEIAVDPKAPHIHTRQVKAMSRLDFVRGPGDAMLLMELELIEPSLYLRMDTASPARFARALDAAASASG